MANATEELTPKEPVAPPSLPDDDAMAAPLRDALASPSSDAPWDVLEEAAASAERPEVVADAYLFVLATCEEADLVSRIGQRAVRFHDEWFDDPARLVSILERVLARRPDESWAFERLVLALTVGARWDELLAAYDRALVATDDRALRARLLDEAAHVAKDFAGQADRAIAYLRELLPLRPTDAQLATSLERLLERQGRHRDLVDLWTARLSVLSRDGKLATRARIASCWLDKLQAPDEALAVCEVLLAEDPHDTAGCKILERIGALATAPKEIRRRALALLEQRYATTNRIADVVRVLEIALADADLAERPPLHRQIIERLVELGREEDALGHAAAWIELEPASDDARERLRALSESTGKHERRAEALAVAADAVARASGDEALRVGLLVEAARTREDLLHDDEAAAELFTRALASASCTGDVRLEVARRLEALLDRLGRAPARLDVLEELADLEPEADAKKHALARAAVLAASLGDVERALASWERRLASDPGDLEALDAVVDLLHRDGRHGALVEALRRRVAASTDRERRRADLVRIATHEERDLGRVAEAIETFRAIEAEFGSDAETIDALTRLLAAAREWSKLAEHLAAAAREAEPARRAELLCRLGDVHRESLDGLASAGAHYRDALAADPSHAGARAGLRTILEGESGDVRASAAATLAEAYRATDDWRALLEIVEHRVALAGDPSTEAAVLVEAARIHEQRADDPSAALAAIARAFPLTPSDASLELELVRLAQVTDGWPVAIEALGAAIEASAGDALRAASLRVQQGALLELKIGDLPRALDAYLPVLSVYPESAEATEAVVRVAGRIGRWDDAARALVDFAYAQRRLDPEIVAAFETIVEERQAWDAATAAVEEAVARAEVRSPVVAREIETQIALWHRDRRGDAAKAEQALTRAVGHDARDAETLRLLAVLQRQHPDSALLDTLLALAAATDGDLGVLYEAAQVALDVLDDRARASEILDRLLETAAERWQRIPHTLPTLPPTSAPARPSVVPAAAPIRDLSADSFASWALDRLVMLHVDARDEARAIDVLVRGARLPFEPEAARNLLHRAAELATGLPDTARAIALYREILDGAPYDARAIAALARLYEANGLDAEFAGLRRHQLELARRHDERIPLRLDLARVLGRMGAIEEQIEALRANLEEQPGERTTIERAIEVLEREGRNAELAHLLTEQALLLEAASDDARAAELWAKVATLSEERLDDVPRALASWGRVVALRATTEAYDALARLHATRGETAQAIEWLERRLAATPEGARADTVARLAAEHLRAGDRATAMAALAGGLSDEPHARALREMLAAQHREAGEHEELAALLREGAAFEEDAAVQVEWLREAAEIHVHQLGDPASAVPLLEHAVSLAESLEAAPGRDRVRPLKIALAEALRLAGRGDEARTVLDELVAWYGRRRPPERARVHVELAHLARARGEIGEALAQLELASSMDMSSAAILRSLGALALEASDYPRAERAYRALLLAVRRPGATLDAAIGPSEVLFELHRIAKALGQEERARENLESAFEAASQSEAEGRRFVQLLRETGNEAFLVRALRARIAVEQDEAAAAAMLIELADVLDGLGRVEEALDARLDALAHEPDSIPLHLGIRDVARRAGKLDRYEERLRALAERAKLAGDADDAAAFLLRLGEVLEEDVRDLERAAGVYVEAEATGARLVAALRAVSRVARARGDRDEELRALRRVVQIDDQDAEGRTESLYRLAELALASPADLREGVEMLGWAIDRDPQLDRALDLLRRVEDADEGLAELHERVARQSSDPRALLEALERVAGSASPSFDLLREGAELATRIEEPARAERFLLRAVELARAEGLVSDATWAFVALSERRRETGSVREAIDLLLEAADASEAVEAFDLRLLAAELAAGPGEDLRLAADTYASLLARDAGDRRVWEPLLGVYRRLGDRVRLEALIAETIENVFDSGERNVLRLERARLLLDEPGREADAAEALREILDDEPDQEGAARALLELYERTGRTDDMVVLLENRLDRARDRGDVEAVVSLSTRLGQLLEGIDRERALEVYRAASALCPQDKSLLELQVRLLRPSDEPGLRADTLERLLALESGEAAASLSLEVAALRQSLDDERGVVRALERGFRESPTNEKVRVRLEKALAAAGDFRRLAEITIDDARARTDRRSIVARLRDAARIHLDHLADPTAAAAILAEAREHAPEDLGLLCELASARAASGAHQAAVAELDAALGAPHLGDAARVTLLRARSELRLGAGDSAGAVEDLEAAYALGGAAIAPDLVAALERRRVAAAHERDLEGERLATQRLVEVLSATGEGDRAHDVLVQWLGSVPDDRDALRALATIDATRSDWSGVVDAYARLVRLETGEARAEAALALADAADACERLDEARIALELAVEAAPGDARVRERLRRVYEVLGLYGELAALTYLDAQHAPDEATRFELLLTVGDLYLRTVGEEARAIVPLEEALELRPFHHEATLLLADALTLAGEVDRAMQLLTPAIERHKGRRTRELAALQHRMARAANAGGGRDVEMQWLQRALECDMQNGQVAAELAEVAMELRAWDVAIKALKAITLLRTPGPMSRALATLRQGQIAHQQGDSKRAVLLAKKALSEEPTLVEAEEFLRSLGV